MEQKHKQKHSEKISEVALFILSLAALLLLSCCILCALGLYRAAYPEVYNKKIVGQMEVPKNFTRLEEFMRISLELWPLSAIIVVIGIFIFIAILSIVRSIFLFINRIILLARS